MNIIRAVRLPTEEQEKVWALRRSGVLPSDIAEEMGVSRPYVSQAQRIAEDRIQNLMEFTAQALRIEDMKVDTEVGFAAGKSPSLGTIVFLTYTPKKGIQTWYHHRGNCSDCEKLDECELILEDLSREWEIALPEKGNPSEKGIVLFEKILERLGWDIEI